MKTPAFGKIVLLVMLALAPAARAQELEPRAYSPSPVGTSFLVVGFGRSSGGVTFDPTIPITDVQATLYAPLVGIGHSFGLFGRAALITAGLPYVWGDVTGDIGDQSGRITRSGLADLNLKFSVNLRGCPALTPREFAASPHRTFIVATSLTVDSPTGQYDNTKLINIGTNRWGFKPEIGFSYPVKRVDLDLYFASWFFTENSLFYPGQSTRAEDALTSVQAHVSYTVRRALWVALDSTWYGGGAARTNNGPPIGRLSNSRLGATASIPLGKKQSLKLAFSSGATTQTGASFNTVSVGWQHVWLH